MIPSSAANAAVVSPLSRHRSTRSPIPRAPRASASSLARPCARACDTPKRAVTTRLPERIRLFQRGRLEPSTPWACSRQRSQRRENIDLSPIAIKERQRPTVDSNQHVRTTVDDPGDAGRIGVAAIADGEFARRPREASQRLSARHARHFDVLERQIRQPQRRVRAVASSRKLADRQLSSAFHCSVSFHFWLGSVISSPSPRTWRMEKKPANSYSLNRSGFRPTLSVALRRRRRLALCDAP